MKEKISRSEVLRLVSAAALGSLAGGFTGSVTQASDAAPFSPSISVSSLGIKPSNTAAENRKALVEGLTGSGEHLILEAGDYLLDNSDRENDDSGLTIRDFEGRLTLLPGARIVFTNPSERGVWFKGGTGAIIEGWNSVFRRMPSDRRNAQELLAFSDTTDTLVSNCRIEGSAAAGLLFEQCIRPRVSGATICDTMADGLHFANCEDVRASDIVTANTGDDGLAFVNYGGRQDLRGGMAANIRVYRAVARGISVVGQSEIMVSNFLVDTTSASGLIVAQEQSYDTRVPSYVRLSNGIVKNAGSLPEDVDPEDETPRDGIFLSRVGESVIVNDVRIVSPRDQGVNAFYAENARQLHLSNVYIEDAGAQGVQLRDQAEVFLDEIFVKGSEDVGFTFQGNDRINYGRLVAINTCKSNPSQRAFDFEGNRLIQGELLQIEATDSEAAYIGSEVNASGTHVASGQAQKGIYGRIDHLVQTSAAFAFTNSSELVGTTQGT